MKYFKHWDKKSDSDIEKEFKTSVVALGIVVLVAVANVIYIAFSFWN